MSTKKGRSREQRWGRHHFEGQFRGAAEEEWSSHLSFVFPPLNLGLEFGVIELLCSSFSILPPFFFS